METSWTSLSVMQFCKRISIIERSVKKNIKWKKYIKLKIPSLPQGSVCGCVWGGGLVLWPQVCDVMPCQEPLVMGVWAWRVSMRLSGHHLLSP